MSATIDQPRQALARATHHKRVRAAYKRSLAEMDYRTALSFAAGLIQRPPPEMATLTVGRLLVVCNGTKRRRMLEILRAARVSETRQLGELSPREVRDLVAEIKRRTER